MAGQRLTDDERQRIIALLHETGNVRETARRTGRGDSTVSRIAREEGIEVAARAMTKNATEARRADNAAKRAQLISDLLDDAQEFRRWVRQPHTVHDFTRDGEFVTGKLDRPTSGDVRNYMVSLGIALDKATTLERVDQAAGSGEAKGVLVQIVESIRTEVGGST